MFIKVSFYLNKLTKYWLFNSQRYCPLYCVIHSTELSKILTVSNFFTTRQFNNDENKHNDNYKRKLATGYEARVTENKILCNT